jgi:hypothetical protein
MLSGQSKLPAIKMTFNPTSATNAQYIRKNFDLIFVVSRFGINICQQRPDKGELKLFLKALNVGTFVKMLLVTVLAAPLLIIQFHICLYCVFMSSKVFHLPPNMEKTKTTSVKAVSMYLSFRLSDCLSSFPIKSFSPRRLQSPRF